MTRALFLTTKTNDCTNHVQAWNAFSSVKAEHYAFDHRGLNGDWRILEIAAESKPEIIFYIGACEAPGNPTVATFQALRAIAPMVNICSDAADRPWHKVLEFYRKRECFDLQVSIDGAKEAPVDLATLTPVDAGPFAGQVRRDIRCGFSGTVGRWNQRSETVKALAWFGGLTVRAREGLDSYDDHARFLKRCRMVLNISFTGTGHAHHIKGRVLETGWAGGCLLESEGSPIAEWFPEGSWVPYRDPPHAAHLIATLDDLTIERTAQRLSQEVRTRFSARTIYEGMLARVDRTVARPAA